MSAVMTIAAEHPAAPDATVHRSVGTNHRLRDDGLSASDRNFALAMHLSPFASLIGVGPLAFLAPLVLWLIRKNDSPFDDDHGREVVNFMISMLVWALILTVSIIGIPLLLALAVVAVVNPVRAAIAAGRGEYFRYPMTFRML